MRKQMNERISFGAEDRIFSENAGYEDAETESGLSYVCDGIIHVAEKGDTLYRLSEQYHVSVSDIMYENPYANIYNLQPGDEICIPVSRKIKG